MKIHLIKRQTIVDFIAKNKQSTSGFENWLSKIKYADWSDTNDIKNTFKSADLLGKGTKRVIFDIGGNKYRMICTYQFGNKNVHLFIKWMGTHAEYDKICKKGKQYNINQF